jgi:hypothetical protein
MAKGGTLKGWSGHQPVGEWTIAGQDHPAPTMQFDADLPRCVSAAPLHAIDSKNSRMLPSLLRI